MIIIDHSEKSIQDKSTNADPKVTDGGMKPLALDFEPGDLDVICGRGKTARGKAVNY